MKRKIIWFVYALFFLGGLFLKSFANTEVFRSMGQMLDFSVTTLMFFLQFIFYLVLAIAVLLLRRTSLFCPDKVPAVIEARKALAPSALFLAAVLFLQIGARAFIPCQTLSYNSLLAMFLFGSTLVILAPIMEELYFREIMLDHFLVEKKMTRAGAITLSAILFFLPHLFNENLSFVNFVFGFFIALVFLYTRKILLAIIIHACMNLVGLLFVSGAFPVLGKYFGAGLFFAVLPLMAAAFVLLVRSARKAERAAASVPVS